jgi:hypothetical protein
MFTVVHRMWFLTSFSQAYSVARYATGSPVEWSDMSLEQHFHMLVYDESRVVLALIRQVPGYLVVISGQLLGFDELCCRRL